MEKKTLIFTSTFYNYKLFLHLQLMTSVLCPVVLCPVFLLGFFLPLFSSEPFEDAIQSQSHLPCQGQSQTQISGLHKAASVDNSSPLLVRSLAFRAQEELEGQTWYHGEMSRRDAEKLLKNDGDFLVRTSTTNPGSYVLTGMHFGLAKHLLLVDPEGTVG